MKKSTDLTAFFMRLGNFVPYIIKTLQEEYETIIHTYV